MKINVSKRETYIESDTDVPSSFLPLFLQVIKVNASFYVRIFFCFLLPLSTLPPLFLMSLQVNPEV